jgi:hypothetical protein
MVPLLGCVRLRIRGVYHQDGNGSGPEDAVGNTPQKQAADSGASVGSDDDKVDLMAGCVVDQLVNDVPEEDRTFYQDALFSQRLRLFFEVTGSQRNTVLFQPVPLFGTDV